MPGSKYINHKSALLVGILLFIHVTKNSFYIDNDDNRFIRDCDLYLNSNKFNKTQVLIDNIPYPQTDPTYERETYDFECINRNNITKIILFWHKVFESLDFKKTLHELKCPIYNCEITNDRSKYRQSSMVVFYMPTLYQEWYKVLPNKYSHQKWIFASYEAPTQYDGFGRYNGLFDYAATYRLDSDFSSYYAYESYKTIWNDVNVTYEISDYFSQKTELVAIIVSNCGPYDKSKRFEYLIELNKTIPIHIYGKCGTPCPQECRLVLSKKYKFYLSFENSICKDYITEKFFDILKYDIVPVVRGASTKSYEAYAPSSAFINALDFKTPGALGEYLLSVAKDKDYYNSFFYWKKFVQYSSPSNVPLCEMCLRLNLDFYYPYKNDKLDKLETYWNKDLDCEIY